jgi:hypothetical protein
LPKSRGNMTAHKNAIVTPMGKGVLSVNTNDEFYVPSGSVDDWSVQLAVYAIGTAIKWGIYDALDESPILVGIDQLACKTISRAGHSDQDRLPRVAAHRWLCSAKIRQHLKDRVELMWETINSDHIFRWMTKEESQRRCDELEKLASIGKDAYLFR